MRAQVGRFEPRLLAAFGNWHSQPGSAYPVSQMCPRDAAFGANLSSRTRVLRRVALGVVGALLLAAACFLAADWLRLAALFAVPMPGAFGTTARDLNFTAEQYAAFEARARSLSASATWMTRLSLSFVAMSGVATAWCAWQTRTEMKRWHWLSFFGLAGLPLLVFLGNSVSSSKPAVLGFLALDALALACAVGDLKRRQYGAPGRIVAWATALFAVALGAVLWTEVIGPNGFIGRWLRYG